MRNAKAILSLSCVLGACATSGPPLKAYIGSERPLGEVAVLKASPESREFRTTFIEHAEGRTQFGASTSGPVSELRLLPGEYTVRLLCSGPTSSGKPYLFVRVGAGKTYEIACSRTGGDERQVRGAYSDEFHHLFQFKPATLSDFKPAAVSDLTSPSGSCPPL